MSGSSSYLTDDDSNLFSIDAGTPESSPESWEIQDGLVAEEIMAFKDRFPNCLPNTVVVERDLDDTDDADLITYIAGMKVYEYNREPLVYNYANFNYDDDRWEYWGTAYGEELPIFPDRYGNLCTNMDEDVDVGTRRVFLAFNDGLFDMTIADIDDSTDVALYPDNVNNIVSFFAIEDFDGLFANQVADFTTYWDFLSAVAKAPAFCNGVAGGLYSRFADAAMCAKEMAGMLATMITQTNAWNADMVDADGNPVPYYQQGIAET